MTPSGNAFGLPQRPGDRKSEGLRLVNGMAMDASGNVVVLDHMGDGSRIQKLNPQFVPIWQQMCLEFSRQSPMEARTRIWASQASGWLISSTGRRGDGRFLGPRKLTRQDNISATTIPRMPDRRGWCGLASNDFLLLSRRDSIIGGGVSGGSVGESFRTRATFKAGCRFGRIEPGPQWSRANNGKVPVGME